MNELLDMDDTRLRSLIVEREMINNHKDTCTDRLVHIPADKYELLLDLAIECLRDRLRRKI